MRRTLSLNDNECECINSSIGGELSGAKLGCVDWMNICRIGIGIRLHYYNYSNYPYRGGAAWLTMEIVVGVFGKFNNAFRGWISRTWLISPLCHCRSDSNPRQPEVIPFEESISGCCTILISAHHNPRHSILNENGLSKHHEIEWKLLWNYFHILILWDKIKMPVIVLAFLSLRVCECVCVCVQSEQFVNFIKVYSIQRSFIILSQHVMLCAYHHNDNNHWIEISHTLHTNNNDQPWTDE